MAVATRRRPHSASLLPLAKEKLRHLASGFFSSTTAPPPATKPQLDSPRTTDLHPQQQPPPSPPPPHDSQLQSPDDMLLDAIIAVLQTAHPAELSTKQIYDGLLKDSPDAAENCKTALILSTKLNSYWRRYHMPPVNAKVDESSILRCIDRCPLARSSVSVDGRKKLVFKFLSPDDRKDLCAKRLDAMSQPSPMSHQSVPGSVTPPYHINDKEPENVFNNNDNNNDQKEPSPSHSVAIGNSPPPSPPYQLRKVIKRTPNAFVGPTSKRKSSPPATSGLGVVKDSSSTTSSSRSKFKQSVPPGANLYYDHQSFSSLFTLAPDDLTSSNDYDVSIPEDMQLDDLDTMFM